MNLNTFFETYNSYQKHHMKHNTWEARTSLIRCHLLSEFGTMELKQITPVQINSIYDSMEEAGLKQNTIFGVYAAMRSFFRLAEEYGYIEPEDNPVHRARIISFDLGAGKE